MLVAQITDPHVVARGERFAGRIDSAASLRDAIHHLHRTNPRPDVVLATGDLVNDGFPEEYDHLEAVVEELEIPLFVVPGNHDDRTEVRRRFADHVPPGEPDTPICYVVDDYPVRLVALDTTVPGAHGGRIGRRQLDWLDRALAAAPERPTIVFQHHPPFRTGIEWMDAVGLEDAIAEAEVVRQHPQVMAVVCGHVHRHVTVNFGGTVASCWPSTTAQVALALDGRRFLYVDEAPAVALHRWEPGEPGAVPAGLVSHVSAIGARPVWLPDWAIAEGATLEPGATI